MQATMIKIEASEKMSAAIARCRKNHPKVRRVDASTVKVFGNGGAYTVRFAEPKAGLRLALCDCKAGVAGSLCYHVPAALAAPVAVVTVPVVSPAPVITLPAQSACAPASSRIEHYIYVCPRSGKRIPSMRVDGWDV